MKVCVVGAGSIGATIGAKLSAAGEQVCLLARGAHLEALRSQGLQFVDRVGSRSGTYRLPASAEPSDFGPQDVVVIALKAYSVPAMLPRLAPLVDSGTVVLPALNGLPWWYFYRSGGPYEGMRLRSLDPGGTMDAALDCARVIGCVAPYSAGRMKSFIAASTTTKVLPRFCFVYSTRIKITPAGPTNERPGSINR